MPADECQNWVIQGTMISNSVCRLWLKPHGAHALFLRISRKCIVYEQYSNDINIVELRGTSGHPSNTSSLLKPKTITELILFITHYIIKIQKICDATATKDQELQIVLTLNSQPFLFINFHTPSPISFICTKVVNFSIPTIVVFQRTSKFFSQTMANIYILRFSNTEQFGVCDWTAHNLELL